MLPWFSAERDQFFVKICVNYIGSAGESCNKLGSQNKVVFHSYQTGVPEMEFNLFAAKPVQILLQVSEKIMLNKTEVSIFRNLLPHGKKSESPSNGGN